MEASAANDTKFEMASDSSAASTEGLKIEVQNPLSRQNSAQGGEKVEPVSSAENTPKTLSPRDERLTKLPGGSIAVFTGSSSPSLRGPGKVPQPELNSS